MMKSIILAGSLMVCGAALADAPKVDASRIEVSITKRGFEPGTITVAAHKPLDLVFTRTTDATCAKKIVISLDDGKKIERELPLGKPVEIPVTFAKAGKLTYACGMDMMTGTIVVQ